MVISAPTGSGKTVIFELAIIRLFLKFKDLCSGGDYKIIYIAPVKALCAERLLDWSQKFNKVGLKCCELTGDSDINDVNQLVDQKLIVTTPEKWDSITRRWRDTPDFFQSVRLVMIDEVHLLGEDNRGPTLEAVISRTKTIYNHMDSESTHFGIRYIAVSATIPNIQDLATWLGQNQETSFFA